MDRKYGKKKELKINIHDKQRKEATMCMNKIEKS